MGGHLVHTDLKSFKLKMGFPCGAADQESVCNAGDLGSIPGLGRSPGGGHGNPLQYSCLGNSVDRGAWWATVHRILRVGPELVTKLPPSPGQADTYN